MGRISNEWKERQVLWVDFRKELGIGIKSWAKISLDDFSEMTGIEKLNIVRVCSSPMRN